MRLMLTSLRLMIAGRKFRQNFKPFVPVPISLTTVNVSMSQLHFFILDSLEVKESQLGLWSDTTSITNAPKQKVIPISVFPSVFSVSREALGTIPDILPSLKTSNSRSGIYKLSFFS